ncbi:MAG: hypothetical protein IAG13_25300 [Deltaproteobacteria bacterium]|nr:hypothetical protein [Nannocystaceae bacterium]
MRLASTVLAFGLGACASLDMREDDRNFDLYCTNGEREEPLCREIELRRSDATRAR